MFLISDLQCNDEYSQSLLLLFAGPFHKFVILVARHTFSCTMVEGSAKGISFHTFLLVRIIVVISEAFRTWFRSLVVNIAKFDRSDRYRDTWFDCFGFRIDLNAFGFYQIKEIARNTSPALPFSKIKAKWKLWIFVIHFLLIYCLSLSLFGLIILRWWVIWRQGIRYRSICVRVLTLNTCWAEIQKLKLWKLVKIILIHFRYIRRRSLVRKLELWLLRLWRKTLRKFGVWHRV